METNEIKSILKENEEKEIIFGKEPKGLHEIWLEKDKITFTSDNEDYLMSNKLEEVIENLHKKFELPNFHIMVHFHSGTTHDKDISLNIKRKDIDKIAEIIKFIMDNFYKNKDWKYLIK